MRKARHIVIFTWFFALLPLVNFGQDKVRYKAGGSMDVFKLKGEKIQRLTTDVVFVQKGTTIYCDSALFYKKRNSMEALGRVRIVDDSITITALNLFYDGNTKRAKLQGNVVYTKGLTRLTTDHLDYDMEAEIAHYFGGGTLRDTTNTLTSQTAYYYAKQHYATFKTNVILTAPAYLLKSNDLHYNTKTKIATTPSETEIITENGTKLDADGGEFRTVNDQSIFVDGKVETPSNVLEGNSLFFDELNKYYKAAGDVKLIAKDKDIIIIGNEGYHDEINGVSKIFGAPVMKRIMKKDTFYVSADTLVYLEGGIDSLNQILAYSNVKMFKTNMQGLADSLVYLVSDSLMYMYEYPILWNGNNQIASDTIRIEISNNTIKRMLLRKNAFLSAKDIIQNFNQVKGRNMTANFIDGTIDNVDVVGNGESIYYALAKGNSRTIGMNRILCSNLRLHFRNNNLRKISAYVKPEARFIPPHEFTPEVQKLEGFLWRGEERPTLEEILAYKPQGTNSLRMVPEKNGKIPGIEGKRNLESHESLKEVEKKK